DSFCFQAFSNNSDFQGCWQRAVQVFSYRFGRSRGIKCIHPTHNFKKKGRILYRVGNGTNLVKRGSIGDESVSADPAVGRFYTVRSGKGSRLTNGSTCITPQGCCTETGSNSRGRTSGGTSGY